LSQHCATGEGEVPCTNGVQGMRKIRLGVHWAMVGLEGLESCESMLGRLEINSKRII